MTTRKGVEHVTRQATFPGLGVSEVDKSMEDWFHFCSIKEKSVPKTTEKLNQFLVEDKGIGDRISRLPNEILSKILSYLPLREAARSSILSNRWRYLWRTTSYLHFDIVNYKDTTFVSWVDQILKNYNGLELESFRVKHSLGNESCSSHVDRWVRFAIEKQVGILELASPNYCFPCWLFGKLGASLKHLSLANCILKRHPDFSNFKSLVSLSLREMNVSCAHLARVFSGCIALKWLTLARCNMNSPRVLSIASSSLKHLSFFCCFNLEEIEIDAVELVSFELRGTRPALRFKHMDNNVPQVARFAYRPARDDDDVDAVDYAFGALPIDLPLLRTLFLSSPPLKADSIPTNNLSTFMNLRRLVLAITKTKPESLVPLGSSLLEACPFLHKLELHLCLSSSGLGAAGEISRQNMSKFTHNYLKEVEIYGFYGHNIELEMTIYLLNYAVYLETIVLNSTIRSYSGNGEYMILKARDTIIPGRHIRELLAKQYPPSCEYSEPEQLN